MSEVHRPNEVAKKPISVAERVLQEQLQKRASTAKFEAVSVGSMEELQTFIPDPAGFMRVMSETWEEQEQGSDPGEKADRILNEVIHLAVYLKALKELLEAPDDENLGNKISNSRAYLPEKVLFFSKQPKVREALNSIFANVFTGEDEWLMRLEVKASKQPEKKWVSPRRFIGSSP